MQILRTPDERFANLPDFPYAPHYTDIYDASGVALRIAAIDEGPRNAAPVLLLHGEPTWSFLYRKIIARLVANGHRAVAPRHQPLPEGRGARRPPLGPRARRVVGEPRERARHGGRVLDALRDPRGVERRAERVAAVPASARQHLVQRRAEEVPVAEYLALALRVQAAAA